MTVFALLDKSAYKKAFLYKQDFFSIFSVFFFLQLRPSIKDDFALLVLTKKHNRPFLSPATVNSSVAVEAKSYVYFSAFDDVDKPKHLMYRVCQVQGEAYGVVYQECSTENGASGAGVYMQVYDLEINDWDRVVSINWCDSLARRIRNSASEASQAWPGGEKGLFSSPRPCSAFHPAPLGSLFASYWCECKLFFFGVKSNIVLLFSLLLIACWNTEH